MNKEVLHTYNELSQEARSADDLAILREMALEDEGKHADGKTETTIEVVNDNDETEIIDVKNIGAGVLSSIQRDVQLAEASKDWHSTQDK